MKHMKPDQRALELFRDACLRAAHRDTSCYPEIYDEKKSRLDGHCGAVAYLIHGLFGGDIVTGRVNNQPHYWNRLPDGKEVDLTSCQFGGDGMTPLRSGRKVRVRTGPAPLRFLVFGVRVEGVLDRSTDFQQFWDVVEKREKHGTRQA